MITGIVSRIVPIGDLHAHPRNCPNGGSFTNTEWKQLLKEYDYTCLKCGKREPEIKITADHVLPLFMGGTSYISNIQPLCKSCNDSKGTKHIDYRTKPVRSVHQMTLWGDDNGA